MIKKCGRRVWTSIILVPLLTIGMSGLSGNGLNGLLTSSLVWCVSEAAESAEIFAKDISKQKATIEKDFEKLDEALLSAKLQEARSGLEVIEYKIGRMKKNLTKQEFESLRWRMDKSQKTISVKEDSLVLKAYELIRTKGVDAALSYTQNDLRIHGVAEKKINSIEKKILKDAPAIQQSFEREEIARVIKILETGGQPDSMVNPYILKSAHMILKAKTDSVQKIERSQKLKGMEEQEQLDRVRMQKEIKELKERKKKEEELALKKKEEEFDSIKKEEVLAGIKQAEDTIKHTEEITHPPRVIDQSSRESSPSSEPECRDTTVLPSNNAERKHGDISEATNAEVDRPPENIKTNYHEEASSGADNQAELVMTVPEQPESKSVQMYLNSLKSNQHGAQEKVMEIYGLLENHQGLEALEKFKQNRGFIATHVDPQVFTILEQTIMQSVMESKSMDSSKHSEIANKDNAPFHGQSETAPEQEHLIRINGFIRDNKVEAAYAEFKRSEKKLKKYMSKDEFKQFKKMVENAYKTRHPGD
jgi:hypothetical protein